MIYIVAGHCFSAFNWQNSPVLERLTTLLLANGTIFFVFIAGYLFQYLSKSYAPKKYFFAKLTKCFITLFFYVYTGNSTFCFFSKARSCLGRVL